jgi:hypothetical protein
LLERDLNAGPMVGNPRIAAEEDAFGDDRPDALGIVVRIGRGELASIGSRPGNTKGAIETFGAARALDTDADSLKPGNTKDTLAFTDGVLEAFCVGKTTTVGRDDTVALDVATTIGVEGAATAVLDGFAAVELVTVLKVAEDSTVDELFHDFGVGKVTTVGGGDTALIVRFDDFETGETGLGEGATTLLLLTNEVEDNFEVADAEASDGVLAAKLGLAAEVTFAVATTLAEAL